MAHLLGPMTSCLQCILMVSDRPEQSTGHAFLHKQVYSLPFREIPQIKKADFILSEILTRFSKKK